MATQTIYYEFNKPTGNDLVNPLVDEFPNWDIADAALHELDERSIANATEVVSLGVHAISRLDQNTKFIKWIATANYTAGDTFTVDGNVVAVATPSGEALATGAYVTGAVILACLNADDSAMTIYVTGTNVATDSARLGGELPSYYAKQSDMTSAQIDIGNIQALNGNTSIASIGDGTLTGAVNKINSDLNTGSVYVTADGVKTYKQLLDELYTLIDFTKITNSSKIVVEYTGGTLVYHLMKIQGTDLFYLHNMSTSSFDIVNLKLAAGSSSATYIVSGTTPTFGNSDSYVWASGTKCKLFY